MKGHRLASEKNITVIASGNFGIAFGGTLLCTAGFKLRPRSFAEERRDGTERTIRASGLDRVR